MRVDPRCGDVVLDLDPARGDEVVERAPRALADAGEHGVVVGALGDQVVAQTTTHFRDHPPARPPVADGVDDCRRVLGGDARAQEVPQRDVGSFELVLGRQHMGRHRGRVVGDDLGGGEHVEVAQRRLEDVGLRERGQQVAAEVEHGADVAGADLVSEHRARPLPHERVRLGPAGGAGPERSAGRRDRELKRLELVSEAGVEPVATRPVHGVGEDHRPPTPATA